MSVLWLAGVLLAQAPTVYDPAHSRPATPCRPAQQTELVLHGEAGQVQTVVASALAQGWTRGDVGAGRHGQTFAVLVHAPIDAGRSAAVLEAAVRRHVEVGMLLTC